MSMHLHVNGAMSSPDETTILAWVRLVRAHRVAFGGVEAALKAACLPPLAWYDALLELKRSPTGLRAQDLESRTLLPQYNVSRLVDRLERAGYLMRKVDPDDRRSRILTLTSSGRDLLRRMWPVYAGAIQTQLGSRLTPDEARTLEQLLAKIAGPQ